MPYTKRTTRKLASDDAPIGSTPQDTSKTGVVSKDMNQAQISPREEPLIEDRNQGLSQRENNMGGQDRDEGTEVVSGILDIQHEGHGFLRPKFRPSDHDIYISSSQIRRFWLRPGDLVEGLGRPPKDNERYYGLLKINRVNGVDADKSTKRPYFEDLTPIYPNTQIKLSTKKISALNAYY
jgi:transcription termination factor Rho